MGKILSTEIAELKDMGSLETLKELLHDDIYDKWDRRPRNLKEKDYVILDVKDKKLIAKVMEIYSRNKTFLAKVCYMTLGYPKTNPKFINVYLGYGTVKRKARKGEIKEYETILINEMLNPYY